MKKVSLISLCLALLIPAALSACAVESEQVAAQTQASLSSKAGFELFVDDTLAYGFQLRAANQDIVLSSVGYTGRTGALNGILSVIANASDPSNFELRTAVNGGTYFVLFAQNAKIIVTSEVYDTRANAKAGIEAARQAVADYQESVAEQVTGFERFVGEDGQFYFRLRAGNGKIVLSSNAYLSEAGAFNGEFAVAESGVNHSAYKIEKAEHGGFFFTIQAGNGQVVGKSGTYVSKANAERGRDAVIELLKQVQPL
jgi:uncharacterized protein YegP (UPF0339 family)